MSERLFLSCVVPTHERDDLLLHALDSIAAQTRSPDEIIVSDDTGSSSTRAVVNRYAKQLTCPVRYVDASGSGAGTAGASRNCGAKAARGDTLAFLDDDDIWSSTYLARMEESLLSSDVGFVVSWSHHRKGDFTIIGNSIKESLTLPRALFPNPGMTGSNFLVRRSAFDLVGGFDPTLVVANDVDLYARLLRAGQSYGVVAEPLVSQVGHSGGHLTTRSARRAQALEAYRAKWSDELTRAQHRDLTRVVHAALRGKDQSHPRRLLHTALQLWYSSPTRLLQAARLRAKGKPDMFND